ncbi:MAG: thiamine pyrophosphate-dependent enzyme, partial [Desulfobacterales bacterium]|nr:thiamine pyrophosphate-dependent enzyme [Desulfobacterales bacterium]
MHPSHLTSREKRAAAIAAAGSLDRALAAGTLPGRSDLTLAEFIVLGLIRQDVKTFIGILGHGSTEIADVLRTYEQAGLVRMYGVRHETEAVHAATALGWVSGEKAAVITSIGPGALHALAGALAPLSNGIGVWFLLGDETTEDEGPNMQQIPGHEQDRYQRLFSAMGKTYKLHTLGAASTALRRGRNATAHPWKPGPFFLLLPMNTQPALIRDANIRELPGRGNPVTGPAAGPGLYKKAAEKILESRRVVVKVGGGARRAGPELSEFLELADAVAVTSPLVPGLIPFSHPRNMTVGGSKGSISGNFAMEEADLLVAVGSRFVCQSDCSRTAYPNIRATVNINADPDTARHYENHLAMIGDAGETLAALNRELKKSSPPSNDSEWFRACREKRREWDLFRRERYANPVRYDPVWGREVLTQPAAIKTALDWAGKNQAISFFDAGDVQANGFQVAEDETPGRTFTETGSSYMGFAASAVLATAMARDRFYALAFCGDGSFVMNPQILIDGVAHGATGCILIFDNRRMAAISGLQRAQYGTDYATSDAVEV